MPIGPKGQVDRFGKPIPPNQSVKIWINSDGSVPQQRETVKLDANIVASDDADSQATVLTLGASPSNAISSLTTDVVATGPGASVATIQSGVVTNAKLATMPANSIKANLSGSIAAPTDILNTGSASGRAMLYVDIDEQSVTGTSYTSPTWSANKYRSLRFSIKISSGTPNVTVTLTGLSGSYAEVFLSNNGTSFFNTATSSWVASPFATGFFCGDIDCANGSVRTIVATAYQAGGFLSLITGTNDDTTHDVTAFAISLSTSSTFKVTLSGLPT